MKYVLAILWVLAASCASSKAAHIPNKMLPNDGKTSSRAAGMGAGSIFAK